MWKLYDASGKGVAIRTTAGRLKSSLIGEHDICGARVQYVDYMGTFIPETNMLFPFIYKRLSFAHESEYRLLGMWPEPEPPRFLREAVDLQKLIEAVYISPAAPDWMERVVDEVTRRYMPLVDVRKSDLAVDPVM